MLRSGGNTIAAGVATKVGNASQLASFPGRSHHQYFIASSTKHGWGRPGRSSQILTLQLTGNGEVEGGTFQLVWVYHQP